MYSQTHMITLYIAICPTLLIRNLAEFFIHVSACNSDLHLKNIKLLKNFNNITIQFQR